MFEREHIRKLRTAIRLQDVEKVRELIDENINVNYVTRSGMTPLDWALLNPRNRNEEIIQLLIDAGAQVDDAQAAIINPEGEVQPAPIDEPTIVVPRTLVPSQVNIEPIQLITEVEVKDPIQFFSSANLFDIVNGVLEINMNLFNHLKESKCEICGAEFTGRITFCPKCQTPHHSDCWNECGCSTYGCSYVKSSFGRRLGNG